MASVFVSPVNSATSAAKRSTSGFLMFNATIQGYTSGRSHLPLMSEPHSIVFPEPTATYACDENDIGIVVVHPDEVRRLAELIRELDASIWYRQLDQTRSERLARALASQTATGIDAAAAARASRYGRDEVVASAILLVSLWQHAADRGQGIAIDFSP